jgi:hypothetical protein
MFSHFPLSRICLCDTYCLAAKIVFVHSVHEKIGFNPKTALQILQTQLPAFGYKKIHRLQLDNSPVSINFNSWIMNLHKQTKFR